MQSTPQRRYRQLQPEDRVTLASLSQQKYSVRAMAQVLGRSPSTISRELRRNAQPAGYASTTVRACDHRRRLQGRPLGKPHRDGILFGLMRHFLGERWAPEQIALTLACIFPKGHEHRVPHETIYNCIYAQSVGELKRELIATLRHAHNISAFPEAKDRTGAVRSPTW
jgi:transposase, IS30 family